MKKKRKEEEKALAKRNAKLFSSAFRKEDWDQFIEKWFPPSAAAAAKAKYDADEKRDRLERVEATRFQEDLIELMTLLNDTNYNPERELWDRSMSDHVVPFHRPSKKAKYNKTISKITANHLTTDEFSA